MKRFYKLVSTQFDAEGFSILLDGKPVKTRLKKPLKTPYESLAVGILQEWAAQGDIILPDTMPLTQLLNTKLDMVVAERPAMTHNILNYLDTDLICYPTQNPAALAQRQEDLWAPWRLWFAQRVGAPLSTTHGLFAVKQEEAAHFALKEIVEAMDDDRFTILQAITAASGSIILALAFTEGQMDADQILKACTIEEEFKEELYDADCYGPDPLFAKKKTSLKRDIDAAQFYRDACS